MRAWACAALRPGPGCADVPPPTAAVAPVYLHRASYEVAGWAAGTIRGRSGRILTVTNLQAAGPWSLRAAVESESPRIVVFEVGGVVDMAGQDLDVRKPFLTIAGQTAPRRTT